MKANFLRLREFILNEFPGQWESIDGENYPPPDWAKTASSVISAVQLFVMLLFMMGDSLWTFVPGFSRGPPQFYYTVKENPVLAMIMLFLVIPSFVQSYINSGGEISDFVVFQLFFYTNLIFNFFNLSFRNIFGW